MENLYSGTILQFYFIVVQFLMLGKDQFAHNSFPKWSSAVSTILRIMFSALVRFRCRASSSKVCQVCFWWGHAYHYIEPDPISINYRKPLKSMLPGIVRDAEKCNYLLPLRNGLSLGEEAKHKHMQSKMTRIKDTTVEDKPWSSRVLDKNFCTV